MSWFVVDCEADGPCPGLYSMICFGAVRVDRGLQKTFYGNIAKLPGSRDSIPEAFRVSGISQYQWSTFPDPVTVMRAFRDWVFRENGRERPIFASDNLAFDWQWINYYFALSGIPNPFGHSGRRIGDLFCGAAGATNASWKHLRKTKHTHDPVADAKGNAEALVALSEKVGGIL